MYGCGGARVRRDADGRRIDRRWRNCGDEGRRLQLSNGRSIFAAGSIDDQRTVQSDSAGAARRPTAATTIDGILPQRVLIRRRRVIAHIFVGGRQSTANATTAAAVAAASLCSTAHREYVPSAGSESNGGAGDRDEEDGDDAQRGSGGRT